MKRCLACLAEFEGADWTCPHCGARPPTRDGFLTFAPDLAEPTGFDAATFAALASAEGDHFWFRARTRMITSLLRRYFPGAASFLEVGCGTGFVLSAVAAAAPQLRLAGSEAHLGALAIARRRLASPVELWQMDATRIPFADAFDVIGAFDVLEHLDDESVLRELFRSVRRGGGVMLSVPQHPWLWSGVDAASGHRRRYRVGELERKVAAAGFTIVRSTSFVTLLLPLMMAARLRPSARTATVVELTPGRLAAACLGRILDWEVAAIAAGVSFPLGGSRVVVAKRST